MEASFIFFHSCPSVFKCRKSQQSMTIHIATPPAHPPAAGLSQDPPLFYFSLLSLSPSDRLYDLFAYVFMYYLSLP